MERLAQAVDAGYLCHGGALAVSPHVAAQRGAARASQTGTRYRAACLSSETLSTVLQRANGRFVMLDSSAAVPQPLLEASLGCEAESRSVTEAMWEWRERTGSS